MEVLDVILRNTEEVITVDDLKTLLQEKKKLKAYMGIAPTGPFHIGYLVPFRKLLDLQSVGIDITLMIADIHAALDDLKSGWEELELKAEYYRLAITSSFAWERSPRIVRGSEFQLDRRYFYDVLKLSTLTTVKRSMRAASEVTRMKNPKVSELIYPLMQALDEEYLDVDIQVGGRDQRHILAYARDYLPLIGYRKRVEITTPLISSIKGPGTKMSASDPESVIKVYDSAESIEKKIMKAYCPIGEVEGNAVLELFKFFVFPSFGKVKVEREQKFGGDVVFDDYTSFEQAFRARSLHPLDVKPALSSYLIDMFKAARKTFEKHTDLLEQLGPNYLPR